jgi:hypothetical protein
LILTLLLAGCFGNRSEYIKWEYIIPDNYVGYLAIRYDCPGGRPLIEENNTIRVNFKSDGTFCTSSSLVSSWSDGDKAWNTSGQTIPFANGVPDKPEDAICCGSSRVIGGGTVANPGLEMVFFLMWVGPMEDVIASWPYLPMSDGDFFESRFGIINIFRIINTPTNP